MDAHAKMVCDFGRGIAESVRTKLPEIKDDAQALKKAMEPRFTIGSTPHNAGLGLENLRNYCTEPDSLWIISNDAALMTSGNIERAVKLKYPFKGTLIMYTLVPSMFLNTSIGKIIKERGSNIIRQKLTFIISRRVR